MNALLAATSTPTKLKGERLYVVEFEDGWIKVGRSRRVDERLREYTAKTHVWISRPATAPSIAERALITRMEAEAAEQRGYEYFLGVAFDRVIALATEVLDIDSSDDGTFDEIAGRRISAAIAASGMSRVEIAAACGIAGVSLQRKLYGRRPWKLAEIAAIAAVVGVKPTTLTGFEVSA